MATDNAGNYSLPNGYLAVLGEDATPTQHNAPLEDLAAAVTARLPVNGAKAMTGPIKVVDGTVSAPGVVFNTDQDTGLYKTTDGFGVAINGVKVAEFGANGLIVGSGFSAGDAKLTYKTTADDGWVMMDDGTFGDASSGASTRANDDTADAYAVIWAIGSAASIPILTSAGVASTYGATAADDFAAHKRLTLPKTLGHALAGAGAGSGLTARTIGTVVGAETHELTIAESAAHDHGGATGSTQPRMQTSGSAFSLDLPATVNTAPDGNNTKVQLSGRAGTDFITIEAHTHTISSQGGGDAHNNMQPTTFLNVMLKL